MTQLLISDLHLEESRPDLTAAFVDFLENRGKAAEALYILGDLFEFWLGDDHDTAFNRQVIEALRNLDVPKFFMHGNRDFLVGEDFRSATGVTLLEDPSVAVLAGKRVLLMHGDTLCTMDEAYMSLRPILRDPAVQADFLSKSIPERNALVRGVRAQSQEYTREAASDIMDVTPAEVVKVMSEHDVDLMIHGHTHRPDVHRLTVLGRPAQRIVLGDWDKRGWYIEAQDGDFALRSFDIGGQMAAAGTPE